MMSKLITIATIMVATSVYAGPVDKLNDIMTNSGSQRRMSDVLLFHVASWPVNQPQAELS